MISDRFVSFAIEDGLGHLTGKEPKGAAWNEIPNIDTPVRGFL